jgi:hypothetical protein
VNADGMLGRALCEKGRVYFSRSAIKAYQSARRVRQMGSIKFNAHFLYVLENFFPFLSKTHLINRLKQKSGKKHSEMHRKGHVDSPKYNVE